MSAFSHSDVLIVGAGSAGSVLAERLSVDSARTVTVLEAGPGPSDSGVRALTDNGMQLPVGAASPLVSRFATTLTEQPSRPAHIVRGATLGGSGAVNGGYFCRGIPRDFDEWQLPGWAWPEVLRHFRAIETDLDFAGPEHGDRGPIRVRRVGEIGSSTERFLEAAQSAGFGLLADLNAAPATHTLPAGIGAVPLNIVDGIRIGPGAAFLEPALGRPNLTVLTGYRVQRIRCGAGRATRCRGRWSCGSAVPDGGSNCVVCRGNRFSAPVDAVRYRGRVDVGRGGGAGGGSRAGRTALRGSPRMGAADDLVGAPGRPVLEMVLSTTDDIEIRPYTGGFVTMVGDGTPGHPDWPHLGVALMKPGSRGRVSLVSADPSVPPRIEHRYDTNPADVDLLSRGVELAREIAGSTTRLGDPLWSTSQHLCGTAPMGADGDPAAVTDARCQVLGVDGLSVIDGSVLPTIPSRGPHATTVMLAHRAAEFLRVVK